MLPRRGLAAKIYRGRERTEETQPQVVRESRAFRDVAVDKSTTDISVEETGAYASWILISQKPHIWVETTQAGSASPIQTVSRTLL